MSPLQGSLPAGLPTQGFALGCHLTPFQGFGREKRIGPRFVLPGGEESGGLCPTLLRNPPQKR